MQFLSRLAVAASAFLVSLTFTSAASAQSATSDGPLATSIETVIVKSPKNAAMMPYDDVYERLKRMQDSKLDRIRLQIKIAPARDDIDRKSVV